jgi:hypothetical protein
VGQVPYPGPTQVLAANVFGFFFFRVYCPGVRPKVPLGAESLSECLALRQEQVLLPPILFWRQLSITLSE